MTTLRSGHAPARGDGIRTPADTRVARIPSPRVICSVRNSVGVAHVAVRLVRLTGSHGDGAALEYRCHGCRGPNTWRSTPAVRAEQEAGTRVDSHARAWLVQLLSCRASDKVANRFELVLVAAHRGQRTSAHRLAPPVRHEPCAAQTDAK